MPLKTIKAVDAEQGMEVEVESGVFKRVVDTCLDTRLPKIKVFFNYYPEKVYATTQELTVKLPD